MPSWNGAITWIAILSALTFIGSIVVVWILIVQLPADYFTRNQLTANRFQHRHPVIRALWRIIKNTLGLVLLLAGGVMLLTPGQGILCMFIGITMIDFPRKRELIRRIVSRRSVRRMMNRIRIRAGRPPLKFPKSGRTSDSSESKVASALESQRHR